MMDYLPTTEKNNKPAWRILVIDDDQDDFIIAREMLRDAKGRKFDVRWANTFERGREELTGGQYHAVLVDYDLGLHSGIELIREASERGYPAPLILFTGRGNYEVDVEAMEAGATMYLTKSEANPLLLERAIRYAIELKHKEQALKKAEERFAKAFHSSPVALAITSASDGRYIEANESLCQLTGYQRDEILGHTALELGLYADPAQRAELIGILKEQGTVRNYEVRVRTKPGSIRTLLGSFDFIELDNEACMLATLIDITERERMEEASRYSEDKFQAIFQAAPFSLTLARLEDGVILEVNRGWEELFGISREEAVGKTDLALGTVPEPADRERGYRELRDHGRLRDFEMPFLSRTGRAFIARQSAEVIDINGEKYLLAVTEDITERKQTEQEIKESQARLEAVLQAMPVGVWIADQNGKILFKNIQTDRIWGGDVPLPNSIEGYREYVAWFMDSGKLVAADEFPVAQALQTGDQARPAELRIQRFDGTQGAVLAIGAPIKDPDGRLTGAVAINLDITERKQFEHALRLSEERFYKAFNANPNAQVISRVADGRIESINDGFEQLFRYRREEVLGKTSLELGMFADPTDRDEAVRRLRAEKSLRDFELAIRRKSGETRQASLSVELIDLDGDPLMLTVIQDITTRKQAEQALRESEVRFRQLADAMPQLVWTARSDGTVDYYNERYHEYAGIAPEVNNIWQWSPVLHPDDAQATIDAWNHSVQTGEVYQIEHRVRMADGSYCWHLSRGIPIRDSQGNVIRWFGTATNIHAQKESEEKLRRSNHELEQFAFVASHDLKEPLRKIILFGESLQRQSKEKLDEQAVQYVERMQSAAERMQVMIDGLLELSRVNRQGGDFTSIQLKELVGEVVSDLELRIKAAGGEVRIEELPTIEADEMQIRRLFQNLIANGIKFHRPDVPPVVRVSGTSSQAEKTRLVEIRVEDNGIGFEQQDAERIFQPFQRLHGRSEYEGSGLGLAICQKIVERHHGTIEVQSIPQQGTIFVISLPVKQPSI